MAGKKKKRIDLFLNCSECMKTKNDQNKPKKHQNYRTSKAKKEIPKGKTQADLSLNLKKYCKFCQKIQIHKEQIIIRKKSS